MTLLYPADGVVVQVDVDRTAGGASPPPSRFKCLNLPAAGLAPWHAPIGHDGYSSPGSRL